MNTPNKSVATGLNPPRLSLQTPSARFPAEAVGLRSQINSLSQAPSRPMQSHSFLPNQHPGMTGLSSQLKPGLSSQWLSSQLNSLSKAPSVPVTKANPAGVQQAMAKRAAPCSTSSAKKNYKINADADAKGEEAIASLKAYMKQANLNSFQAAFFSRLVAAGATEPQLRAAIKTAKAGYGVKVATELEQGFEKLSLASLIPRIAGAAGRALIPATRAGGNLIRHGRYIRIPGSTGSGFGDAARNAAGSAAKFFKNNLTSPELTKNMITGATAGLLNPYTGASSDDPTLKGSLASAAAGAFTGGLLGKPAANAAKGLTVGSGAGYSVGGLAGGLKALASGEDLASALNTADNWGVQGARIGGGLGAFAGARNSTKALNAMQKADLLEHAQNAGLRGAAAAGRATARAVKNNPLQAATAAGGLLGGIGLARVPGVINEQGRQIQDQIAQSSQNLQNTVAPLAGAAQNFGGLGALASNFGGLGALANNFGGLGETFQQNKQWLVPLLMTSLLGGTGGYALGGGGGAALGGIGLPLLMALLQNPQMFQNAPASPATPQGSPPLNNTAATP